MSRMADDVDDEAEGSAEDTARANGGTLDPYEAWVEGIEEHVERLGPTVLKPRLEALEADRLHVRGYITKIVIAVAIPIVLFLISGLLQAPLMPYYETSPVAKLLIENWTVLLGAIAALSALVIGVKFVVPGLAAHLEYRRKFKQSIGTEVFKAIVPDGTYQPDHHITKQAVDESGLFSGSYSTFRGDDLIRGRIGSIEFEASELRATGTVTLNRRKEHQHSSATPNVTEFHGQIFHFGLTGSIKGHTIVEPENCEGRMFNHRKGFETVAFDGDKEWSELFRVYSTDASEARRILGPGVRKRLLTLHENHWSSAPFLSFVRNHAYVAVHAGRNSLEPTIAKPIGDAELSRLGQFFGTPAMLARELELDGARSTFGGTGASILAQPATAAFGTIDLAKPITTANLTENIFDEPDDQDAARTPPANTRVTMSTATGDGFEATYGYSAAFFLRILWTLALLPFVAAGFAKLAGTSGAPLLAAIVERLPQVTMVSDWAASYPFAFVPLALLFHVVPAWTMLHIPRGVRIGRQEGVRIKKRIWPIPRTLPIDAIAGVKVNDRQVLFQRKQAPFLRRWVSATPLLQSNDEARWVAAHLRRAMKMAGGLRQ